MRTDTCVWLDQHLTAQSLLYTGASCITIQSAHVSTREKQRMVLSKSIITNIIKHVMNGTVLTSLLLQGPHISNAESNYTDSLVLFLLAHA